MKEIMIEKGLIIDDADGVLWSVEELSGKTLSGIEVIRKFIGQEKNTKFFLDKNLNSYLQKQPDCLYAWLDTGFLDRFGNPILVSLLKGADGYAGHDGRYSAVIIGACPHKVSAGAGYSSAVEKFKQIEGMPYTADARSKSGKLKVTKESFKEALLDIYCNLRMGYEF